MIKKEVIENYKKLLMKKSLNEVWTLLNDFLLNNGISVFENKYCSFDEIGHLYEIGLAFTNKISKKGLGKYYTPKDVSILKGCFPKTEGEINWIENNEMISKDENGNTVDTIEPDAPRLKTLKWNQLGIQNGENLVFTDNESIKVKVIDCENNKVEYQGKTYSLSKLATELLNKKTQVQGTAYFFKENDPQKITVAELNENKQDEVEVEE